MAMYWTCEFGANHDRGERCDCMRERELEEKKRVDMFITEPRSHQMKIRWEHTKHEKVTL